MSLYVEPPTKKVHFVTRASRRGSIPHCSARAIRAHTSDAVMRDGRTHMAAHASMRVNVRMAWAAHGPTRGLQRSRATRGTEERAYCTWLWFVWLVSAVVVVVYRVCDRFVLCVVCVTRDRMGM